jgi:hypothetical protein
MAQKTRKRIKHKATFGERLAEEAKGDSCSEGSIHLAGVVSAAECDSHSRRLDRLDNANNLNLTEMRKRKFAYQIGKDILTDGNGAVADSYFDEYSANQSYEDIFEAAFNVKYLIDLIKAVWVRTRPISCLTAAALMA